MPLAHRVEAGFAGQSGARPIDPDAFDRLMVPLGPFEDRPHLAVGVSGGRDSLALVLCAARWTLSRGGHIDAVTVDHRLRPESAAEARQVGEWLAAEGIAHHVLEWTAPRPGSGVEAAAREARYRLLEEFCRARGILHLLMGHHAADQHETLRLRRARRSGPDGLAGMAAVRETPGLRIVRPFLTVPRARMTATLAERGLSWIEDPSNADTRFARAALRRGRGPEIDPGDATEQGTDRARRDAQTAALAARTVALHPAGYAVVDGAALAGAPSRIVRRLVGGLVSTVAGRRYPPRGARLDRLAGYLSAGSLDHARTLGGCVFRPAGTDRFIVMRELAAISGPEPLDPATGQTVSWDGRFRIDPDAGAPAGACLGALGRFVKSPGDAGLSDTWRRALPHGAWRTIPALDARGGVRVFTLAGLPKTGSRAGSARFAPNLPLSGARFATPG